MVLTETWICWYYVIILYVDDKMFFLTQGIILLFSQSTEIDMLGVNNDKKSEVFSNKNIQFSMFMHGKLKTNDFF
jgi:preprotein translocase subunit SecY